MLYYELKVWKSSYITESYSGTLNTAFFDIFTMNKVAKKMNMLL